MSLPVDQTSTLIVTEALKQAGYVNPASTLITRAKDEWLRRVLQRISKRIDLVALEETRFLILDSYKSRYALSADFDRMEQVTVYSGENTGALQAATSSTVTLSSTEDAGEEFVKGKLIFITSGSAKGAVVRATTYTASTKVANIVPSFTTTPSATDTYMIADSEKLVDLYPLNSFSEVIDIGLPSQYYIYGKTSFKELILDKAIDDETSAALKIRYQIYMHKVDLTDSRMTSIYNELHSELTQGVLVEALKDKDDRRYVAEFQLFERYIEDYKRKENREKILRTKMFVAY